MAYTFTNGNTLTLALAREPGRATWITRRDYAFNGSPHYWHRTTYDAEGRPTETEDSLTATRQWLYNRRSELVGTAGTQAHPYDSIGNRLTFSDDFGTATCAANNLNQYTAVNRTIEQSEQSNNSSVEYFWGNDLSGTEQGAGGVGGLLATRIDGVFYVPVYGANGNVMMYVDATGAIAAQYDYDPYGNILQSSGPLAPQFAFGFSTKYHDREVDLVAYQLRTYNPYYGRWLNRDPIEEDGGNGLYLYCNNSFLFDVLGAYAYQSTIWGGFFYQNQTEKRVPNSFDADIAGLGIWLWITVDSCAEMVYGVFEIGVGVSFATVTLPTAAGAVVGAAIATHGADRFARGFWQLKKGEIVQSCTQRLIESVGIRSDMAAQIDGVLAVGLTMGASGMNYAFSGQRQFTTIARWGRCGLRSGDWVMLGPATWGNYIKSGKWQIGMGNEFAAPGCYEEFLVPTGSLRFPNSNDDPLWFLKLLWGQRIYECPLAK